MARNDLMLPLPPTMPGTVLPQLPALLQPGAGIAQPTPVGPVQMPPPPQYQQLQMPPIPQPPGMQAGAGMMPQMPSVQMPKMPALMQNPYATALQREIGNSIGLGIGREFEQMAGLPLTSATALSPAQKAANLLAYDQAKAALGIGPKAPLTIEQKAQNAIDLMKAEEALGKSEPSLVPKTQAQLDNAAVDNPYGAGIPFTVDGIKNWQLRAGRKLTDDQANTLWQQGITQATPQEMWKAAIAYFPSLFTPDQTTAAAGAPGAAAPPALTPSGQLAGYGSKTTAEGPPAPGTTTQWGATTETVPAINDPANLAMQQADAQAKAADPLAHVSPEIRTAAAQTVGEGADYKPDPESLNAKIGPIVEPILQTLGNFGQLQLVKEMSGILGKTPLNKFTGGFLGGVESKTNTPLGLAAQLAVSVAQTANIPLISPAADFIGSFAAPLTTPIDQLIHRAFMQQYLEGINPDSPLRALDPVARFDMPARRPLTDIEKRAMSTLAIPFVPNSDQDAVNYLDAMWEAYRVSHPLEADAQEFAAWAALGEAAGAVGKTALVAKGMRDVKVARDTGVFPAGVKPPEASSPGALGVDSPTPATSAPYRNLPPDIPPPPEGAAGTPVAPPAAAPAAPAGVTDPTALPSEAPIPEDFLDRVNDAQQIHDAIQKAGPLQGTWTIATTKDGTLYDVIASNYNPDDLHSQGNVKVRPRGGPPVDQFINFADIQQIRDGTSKAVLWERPAEAAPTVSPPEAAPADSGGPPLGGQPTVRAEGPAIPSDVEGNTAPEARPPESLPAETAPTHTFAQMQQQLADAEAIIRDSKIDINDPKHAKLKQMLDDVRAQVAAHPDAPKPVDPTTPLEALPLEEIMRRIKANKEILDKAEFDNPKITKEERAKIPANAENEALVKELVRRRDADKAAKATGATPAAGTPAVTKEAVSWEQRSPQDAQDVRDAFGEMAKNGRFPGTIDLTNRNSSGSMGAWKERKAFIKDVLKGLGYRVAKEEILTGKDQSRLHIDKIPEETVVPPAVPDVAVPPEPTVAAPESPAPGPAADAAMKLPPALAGETSVYTKSGFASGIPLDWANDVDRALYTVANEAKKSKSDEAYMQFLRNLRPELSDADIRLAGGVVRKMIGQMRVGSDGRIKVPSLGIGENLVMLHAGISPRELVNFIRNHPKATVATLATGAFITGARQRAQQEQDTGAVTELTDIPALRSILDFGAGDIRVDDVIRGLNVYNNEAIPVAAELSARTVEIPFSVLARAMGANPSNVVQEKSFFDVLQPAGFEGLNLTARNETIKTLQDSWAKRSERNPALAFIMTLPIDPLNWIGWNEGRAGAKAIEEAAAPLLKASIVTADDYQAANNPLSRATGHFFSQMSRAGQAKAIAQEFGRFAYVEVMRTKDPVATLERIDRVMRTGKASLDQSRLAHLWGKVSPIDKNAVMDLMERWGIEHPAEPSDALVADIKQRVLGKSRLNADDLAWLDKKFGYAKRPLQVNRMIRSLSSIQEWTAIHGAPDLSGAVEAVERMSPDEFVRATSAKAREAFPAKESPLTAMLDGMPITHALLVGGRALAPGYQAIARGVGLPLTLASLISPAWTLHADAENLLRSFRGNLAESLGMAKEGFKKGSGTVPMFGTFENARSFLKNWYGEDAVTGRGGLMQAPTDANVLSESKFPIIGGGLNKWAAGGIRAAANSMGPADPLAERLGRLDKLRADAKLSGITPDPNKIKAILGPKPTDGMASALHRFADVVEKSHLGTVYGFNQFMVGQFEGAARTYWIAGEHMKVMEEVKAMLAQTNPGFLDASNEVNRLLSTAPKGIDPAVWGRISAAAKAVGHQPGALSDLVEQEVRGTIDRLNLAKSVFLETDIPYPVQAEWYMALRHMTPEEAADYYKSGGVAEQMLHGGLESMYGNRVKPLVNEILAGNRFNLKTVNGQTDAWREIDNRLEASLMEHKDMWKWSHAVGYTMSDAEKSVLYGETRKINQNWLSLQKAETQNARRMFENEIRKTKGIATAPDEVFQLQDALFDKLMKTYADSDAEIEKYFANAMATGKQDAKLYNEMEKTRTKIWDTYRDYRNDIENRKQKAIEDFYVRGKLEKAAGTPLPMLPLNPMQDVTGDQRIAATDALKRVRGRLDAFTQRQSVSAKEADILRAWVKDTETKINALPESTKAAMDDVHARTARIVQDRLRNHFVDHINTTELDEFARNFIPFWMYDAKGGVYYAWLAQHVPGFYSTVGRLEQMSGGTGYLAGGFNPVDVQGSALPGGDFGVFGTKTGPMRGLWPQRILTFQNMLSRTQPKSVQEFLANEFKNMSTQGLGSAHLSPLVEDTAMLASGNQMSLPPPATLATDVNAYAGGGFGVPFVPALNNVRAHDQFLQSNILQELAGKGIDPYNATPEQRKDAERAVALRDAADTAVPRFTYTSPAKLLEQQDFQNELANMGYAKSLQASWKAQGLSPWAQLDAQEKRGLMEKHPDWAYIFEASDAFKTPEEALASEQIRTWVKKNQEITKYHVDQQTISDERLKQKSAGYGPQEWMKAHTALSNKVAGRRMQNNLDNATGKDALAQAQLDKIPTPQDKAVSDYYKLYSQAILDNTSSDGKIDWSVVNKARQEYLQGLQPSIAQYVQEEITRNETDVEKQFFATLDELDQYDQIPRWIGVPPAASQERSKEEQEYARLRQVRPEAAAVYRTSHPLLRRTFPRNPARDQFLKAHPLLALWFIPVDAKKMPALSQELNQTYFGEPVQADWQGSTAPLPGSQSAPPPPPPAPPPQQPAPSGGPPPGPPG